MKLQVTKLQLHPYALPLRPPVRTARTLVARRQGLRLALHLHDGTVGLGDFAPWPHFAGVGAEVGPALDEAQATCAAWQAQLMKEPWQLTDVPDAPAGAEVMALARQASYALAARAGGQSGQLSALLAGALMTALVDALGQLWRLPAAALLSETCSAAVPVHALVDSVWAAQEAVRAGYRALKIKVGTQALDDELGRLCALRAAVGPSIALRLDANGVWPAPVAMRALRMLTSISPAWLEQPVAADDLPAMAALRAQGLIPIAADELVHSTESLRQIVALGAADGVVLKPSFVGGPWACMDLAHQARAARLDVSVTHALEGTVGRLMAQHVARALACTSSCGLGGGLQGDILPAPGVVAGALEPASGPGLGLSASARAQACSGTSVTMGPS